MSKRYRDKERVREEGGERESKERQRCIKDTHGEGKKKRVEERDRDKERWKHITKGRPLQQLIWSRCTTIDCTNLLNKSE